MHLPRHIKSLAAGILMSLSITATAFASETVPFTNKDVQYKLATRILHDLYANEKDEDLKNAACDVALTQLFGETQLDDLNVLETRCYDFNPSFLISGSYFLSSNGISYVYTNEDIRFRIRNKDDNGYQNLLELYKEAVTLKEETKDMSTTQKISHIHDYVCNSLSYDLSLTQRSLLQSFHDHVGVCNDYAGLFYIMGTYCGLEVDSIYGSTSEGFHAWNRVNVDGTWKSFDTTWDDSTSSRRFYEFAEGSSHIPVKSTTFHQLKDELRNAPIINK